MPNKAEILDAIDDAKSQLDQRLDRIDEAHGSWQGAVGEWSAAQLLQHLHGWLSEMTPAVERMLRGERPTPAGVDYSEPDEWNAKFVAERGEQPYEAARAAFNRAHDDFRAAVAQVPEARFGGGKTINRMVSGVVTHHYAEHCGDLDTYLTF